MSTPKSKAKGKTVDPKHEKSAVIPNYPIYEAAAMKPLIQIQECIGFQKFRYSGENRPGKKYQDKKFMQLALYNMPGKNVRIYITCFDAERTTEIHPNGLVGRDCVNGVYTKLIPVSKSLHVTRIPYLRTERILTKKTKDESNKPVSEVFKSRANTLPSPYREQCLRQSEESQKYDTTKVCFGVIAVMEEIDSKPLFCLSNVVQNASEKTTLKILKLSTEYISAQEGGEVDIFTKEDGPPIIAGKCSVKVVVTAAGRSWESLETMPSPSQIMYKRVISYRVPPFEANPATDVNVRASIHLSCIQSGQTDTVDFSYEPGADSARKLASIHGNKPFRKRPYISDTPEEKVNGTGDVKRLLTQKVKSRQIQDPVPVGDPPKPETGQGTDPSPSLTVMDIMELTPQAGQGIVINVRDSVTGQVFRICSQQGAGAGALEVPVNLPEGLSLSTSTLPTFTLLSDLQRTALASDYGAASATAATPTPQAVNPTAHLPGSNHNGPSAPKKSKYVSPWIVSDEEQKPIITGEDLSFHLPKSQSVEYYTPALSGPSAVKVEVERNPTTYLPGSVLTVSGGGIPSGGGNLLSASLLSTISGLQSSLFPGLASSGQLPSSLASAAVTIDNNSNVSYVSAQPQASESETVLNASVMKMLESYLRPPVSDA